MTDARDTALIEIGSLACYWGDDDRCPESRRDRHEWCPPCIARAALAEMDAPCPTCGKFKDDPDAEFCSNPYHLPGARGKTYHSGAQVMREHVPGYKRTCPHCHQSLEPDAERPTCGTCGGKGYRLVPVFDPDNPANEADVRIDCPDCKCGTCGGNRLCPTCNGGGEEAPNVPCPECAGEEASP